MVVDLTRDGEEALNESTQALTRAAPTPTSVVSTFKSLILLGMVKLHPPPPPDSIMEFATDEEKRDWFFMAATAIATPLTSETSTFWLVILSSTPAYIQIKQETFTL